MPEIPIAGSKEEQKVFTDVYRHYDIAKEDLDLRRPDWDRKDVLFRSYIDKKNWPYRALFVDPRITTILFEKAARTFANKPRGRMIPRESGDAIGAKINTELLSFQWDDNERVDNMPMLLKWIIMYLNAKKYGASFGLAKWHYERHAVKDGEKGKPVVFFDGPNFKPWNNRDVLHNPSYSTVKNWIQLRDYVTFQDLMSINDSARSKPIYKNLDILRQQMDKEADTGGDTRDSEYAVKNLTIKGLKDFLGHDRSYKTIEIVTEYRNERWITFSPKHGVILRDIPNPYKHGQIPVLQLKFKPIDEDTYGMSEIEPVEKLQKIIWAVGSQYMDAVNMSLYAPIKVRKGGGAVEMHTLEFGPGKKWMMNDPATDVITHQQNIAGIREFGQTYRFLVGALQEAMGETSAITSSALPGEGDKTATEIKDSAVSRSAMDSFDQIALGEAMKKQMMFWYKMNQQFMFNANEKEKVIQIVGKDAIQFFQNMGLDGEGLTDEGMEMLSDPSLADSVMPSDLMQPLFPVNGETKFSMEAGGQTGKLILEPDDLAGSYDYIPDIGSMSNAAGDSKIQAESQAMSFLTGVNPTTGQPSGIAGMITQEGKRIKASNLFIDYMEDIGFKNADQYIENQPQQVAQPMGGVNGQLSQGGIAGAQGMQFGGGNVQSGGMANSIPALSGGQAQSSIPGSVAVQ